MVFIMRAYEKHRDAKNGFLLLAVLCLISCGQQTDDFGFQIKQIDSRTTTSKLNVVIHQKMTLSDEAEEALKHGVPLSIETRIKLREVDSGNTISSTARQFQIRFLPLTEDYQLTTLKPESIITRPRLRHILAELSNVELSLPLAAGSNENLAISARSILIKEKLPATMRLPVLFSRQWKHDTGWKNAPVSSSPETVNTFIP